MNTLPNIARKLVRSYRKNILRDPYLLELSRWFKDEGDRKLRLDHRLDENSTVVDSGGYLGDFSDSISRCFNSNLFLFEPSTRFYQKCVDRFAANSKIVCRNYGLSGQNRNTTLSQDADGSSEFGGSKGSDGGAETVRLRAVDEAFTENGISNVDLMEVNIEGGEYEVLPRLIDVGMVKDIDHLQIQFHSFVDNAAARRADIQSKLAKTHEMVWCYDFVWECWIRK